jgi:hypothetical protein
MDDEHDDGAPVAILFDVDGCLISIGGTGIRPWRRAFACSESRPTSGRSPRRA